MELQAFSLIVVFSFSLFYLSLCYLKAKIWCNCDICQTYLTSSWTKQFDNLCDWYAHLLRNSPGKTIHIHVLRNTITASPENVEYILRTRFDNFPKGKAFSTILGDLLGRGIFNVDGDMWKFQRKMARLELDRNSVRSYAFDLVNSEIQTRLVPVLSSFAENQTQVDLQDLFKRFSLDTICRFSFGLDPKCLELSLPLSEFAVAFDLASKLSAERALTVSPLVWKVKRMLNVGSERKLRESLTMINALAEEVIRTKRKLGISNSNDLLSRFMKTVNDDVYLRDIVISFLLAGRDTVASSLTSLFLLLCKNPEVMTRIREEADRVIGWSDREFSSYEHLRELHYLHAAVYESMRMYPPIQFDSKFCKEDDVLPDGSVFVGRGTRVTYHPYAMGRVEEIWGSDCWEFKPERWLEDGVFRPQSLYKYPVFQAGLRVCLGKEMAVMEMKSVALSLIRKFEFNLAPPHGRTPRFSPGLTATFSGGVPVFVRER